MNHEAFMREFTALHRRRTSSQGTLLRRSPECSPAAKLPGGGINPRFVGGNRPKNATIELMQIAILGMRLLELMFFVGLLGSAVVVLISFVEDGKELFGDE
jgi:hypothetical protein